MKKKMCDMKHIALLDPEFVERSIFQETCALVFRKLYTMFLEAFIIIFPDIILLYCIYWLYTIFFIFPCLKADNSYHKSKIYEFGFKYTVLFYEVY